MSFGSGSAFNRLTPHPTRSALNFSLTAKGPRKRKCAEAQQKQAFLEDSKLNLRPPLTRLAKVLQTLKITADDGVGGIFLGQVPPRLQNTAIAAPMVISLKLLLQRRSYSGG
jgi:hypothetical protein